MNHTEIGFSAAIIADILIGIVIAAILPCVTDWSHLEFWRYVAAIALGFRINRNMCKGN